MDHLILPPKSLTKPRFSFLDEQALEEKEIENKIKFEKVT